MTDSGEFRVLRHPANPGDEVVLACPVCEWRSEVAVVKEQVNGTWHAFHDLGADYRLHFDSTHRPLPTRLVRAPQTGSSGDPK